MSRGDFGSAARGAGYGAVDTAPAVSHSGGGRTDEGRLFDEVSTNTQRISSNVSSLEKLVKQLGTSQDGDQLRNRLASLNHNTQVLATQTNGVLKELGSAMHGTGKREQRIHMERLRKDFKVSITRLQKVQEPIQENMSMPPAQSRNPFQQHDDDDSESADLMAAEEEERKRQLHEQAQEAQYEVEQYEERADRIHQVERDIVEINEIFRDLGALVHEQGTLVDNIEEHIETGHRQVEEGNRQLSKAAHYQKKARKKMCCLVIILLCVAVALFLVIYLPLRNKK